jgi:hypothetical protein
MYPLLGVDCNSTVWLGLDVKEARSLVFNLVSGLVRNGEECYLAPKSGIEPETYRLGGGRSIH